MQMDTAQACASVDSALCLHAHARTADSLMPWRGTCSGTHTFRNSQEEAVGGGI